VVARVAWWVDCSSTVHAASRSLRPQLIPVLHNSDRVLPHHSDRAVPSHLTRRSHIAVMLDHGLQPSRDASLRLQAPKAIPSARNRHRMIVNSLPFNESSVTVSTRPLSTDSQSRISKRHPPPRCLLSVQPPSKAPGGVRRAGGTNRCWWRTKRVVLLRVHGQKGGHQIGMRARVKSVRVGPITTFP